MKEMTLGEVTEIRIHPRIGIARIGNSAGYFIGPEIPGVPPAPEGGRFKDDKGLIKRQAARFRVFGYNSKGDRWIELTGRPEVSIKWTVHLANRKAAAMCCMASIDRNLAVAGDNRKLLEINPGPRTVSKESPSAKFDIGFICYVPGNLPLVPLEPKKVIVSLGDITMQEDGSLLVLGGSGLAESLIPNNPPVSPFDNGAGPNG